MHPLGCFGSSLAFAPTTAVCSGCIARSECESLVEERRPAMLRLLAKYSDQAGESMAVAWLKPAERKKLRKIRKARELEEAERSTYGDATVIMELKSELDKRSHKALDRMAKMRINPKRSTLEALGEVSKSLGVVIAKLRSERQTVANLTAAVSSECHVAESTAQRDVYAAVSILTSCDRAQRNGPFVELK